MAFLNPLQNEISTVNSTTAPLGVSGVFTGTFESCEGFAEIRISFDADVAGVDCVIQFSPDGVKIERTISIPPVANSLQTNFGGAHTLNPILPFYRVIYTNDTTGQASFTLTTILAARSGVGLISRSTQIINKFNDVNLVRPISDTRNDRNFNLLTYQRSQRAFGINESVGNGAFETIWTGLINYVFPQAAETLQVAAGGEGDDIDTTGAGARKIFVTYLDANFDEQTETINLAGASASAVTSGTAIRVLRAFVIESGTYGGTNTGIIIIENSSSNNPLALIPAGNGRTQDAVYTVPNAHTAYVTKIRVSVGQGNSADLRFFQITNADDVTTPFSSISNVEWSVEDFSGATEFIQETYLKFLEKTDLFFEGIRITGSGDARISVAFEMILVEN